MARGAKKEFALTPEEKLAQALVPEAEQPYRVPENWRWVYLAGLLTEAKNGTTVKQDKSGNGYSVTRIESLQNQTIDFNRLGTIVDKSTIKDNDWYKAGDIALSHINSAEHVGKTALITENMLPLVHGMNLLRLRFANSLYPSLFQYYSQSFQYKEAILSRINMAVNQVSIKQKRLGTMEFPLPPLPEQQRIVDRIESLFAKLDEAKEKAQAVVDGFEDRKAAILHKAFTGELTERWRIENTVTQDAWKTVALEDVCASIFDGDHLPPPKSEDGIPFLVISNVNNGFLSYENTRFVPLDYYESLSDTRKPHVGDLLYTLVGSYGIPVVVDSEKPFCFQRHMALLKLRDIDTYYLWYLLQSHEMYNKASAIATGTAQLTVPIKGLRKMTIVLPSKTEQTEIVRILDSVLSQEQQAKSAAEQVIGQINTMKKAILARAFRGELGTNDPTEESAESAILVI